MDELNKIKGALANAYARLGTSYSKVLAYKEIIATEEENVLDIQDEIKLLSSRYSELMADAKDQKE